MIGFSFGAGARGCKSASGPGSFDPATLILEGWWRPDFPASSPWTPTASAGGSGTSGRDLGTSGAFPAQGSTVNAYTPADFNGSTQGLISAVVASSIITAGAGTIIVLAKADTSTAAAADFYTDPLLFGDAGGNVGLVFTSSGVRFGVYNGSTKQTAHVTQSTGAWFMAAGRWDGTDVRCRVASGSTSDATPVTATGGAGSLGTYCKAGVNYADAARFDGQILEVMTTASLVSDYDLDNIKSYFNGRYALSL